MFNGAGTDGCDAGFVGSTNECRLATYMVGDPSIGSTVELCQSGPQGCHDCLWISDLPGPTNVGGTSVPVGFPLLFVFDYGEFNARQEICQTLVIPNDQQLVGLTIYTAVATFPTSDPLNRTLGSTFQFTITQ